MDDAPESKFEVAAYQKDGSLFEIIFDLIFHDNNLPDEEIGDLAEGEEFLSSHPIIFQSSFCIATSKSKIQIEQHSLLHPFLEKFTPPPEFKS